MKKTNLLSSLTFYFFSYLFSAHAFADNTSATLGTLVTNVSGTFGTLINLVFGIVSIAGLSFCFVAVLKFKQHKDNPQQVTIGQPIGLFFLGAFMMWLPYIIIALGNTITGSSSTGQPMPGEATIVTDPNSKAGFSKWIFNNNN